MADNSDEKKKTLIISMLVFLLGGGGIFLFFIIQGSNDLTGAKGKGNFTYGEAAREGVSSFFKNIGVIPDEDAALSKRKEVIMKERGFLIDDKKAADADISDWMDKSAGASASPRRSASPTSVPRMSGSAGSAVGGGGGSSQSSGSMSRFGDGSSQGNTSISAKSQANAGGAAGKGTLGALKNARALLNEGLRSDSAMTASSKWGQSFGVGGGGAKSGDLSYSKSGLVGLDKIKSGEIASLKTTAMNPGEVPKAGAFKEDKDAESKDPKLQKNKADLEDQMKQAAVKAAADAAAKSAEGTPKTAAGASGSDPKTGTPPPGVLAEAKAGACFEAGKCPNVGVDKTGTVTKEGDGWKYTYTGVRPNGTPYTDTFVKGSDGKITFKGP